MSENQHDDVSNPPLEYPQSPGKQLRQAREEKGLSIQEVASSLRLGVPIITALEADEFHKLPSLAFVRGYMRTYARLLDLPEETLALPQEVSKEPPLVSSIVSANHKQSSSRDRPIRLISILLILLLAISAVVWWLNHSDEFIFARQTVEPVDETALPAQPVIPSLSPSSLPAQRAEEGERAAVESGESEAEAEQLEAVVAAESPVVSEVMAAIEDVVVAQSPSTAEPIAPSEAVEEEIRPRPEPSAATPVIAQAEVELRYQDKSWTEISDNSGERLAFGLIEAGEVLKLRGEAPFSIFLGYAPAVEVYFNDELYDHTPFQRRGIARFHLGGPEHNRPVTR